MADKRYESDSAGRRGVADSLAWGAVSLVAHLPMWLLYGVADVIAGLMHTVIRYRRKAVRRNLSESYPDYTPAQLRRTERRFYRWLADYFVETLRLAAMPEREMRQRLRVEGIEGVNEAVAAGRSVSLLLGHFGNWEWVSSLPLHISDKAVCGQIYHRLHSPVADRLFLRLRSRWGANNIRMQETLRTVTDWHRAGQPSVTGYIADQLPGYSSIHLWTPFLRHDTPVFSGPERISRMIEADVFYCRLSRPRRGCYLCSFIPLGNASDKPKFDITRRYFELLEEDIDRTPWMWLWSHRRWKRTRAEWERRKAAHKNA